MTPANLKVTEILAFVPSGKDYRLALAFYRDLGFTVEWESEQLASLNLDGCRFFLQNFSNEEMQKNFMMSLEVEDLDAWWEKIESAELTAKYPGVKAVPPKDYPWGRREIHLIAPDGALWRLVAATAK